MSKVGPKGKTSKEFLEWYKTNRTKYQLLAEMVADTIKRLLPTANIDYLDVSFRAKELESLSRKIGLKNYRDPAGEITDLAGIRIVTFIERDVDKASELIKNNFCIHEKDSTDKTTNLGHDRFGYRSKHFICDIGEARGKLSEFAPYIGLSFEIQIRTALQHAWAEIEHDRSYKYSGELPSHLKRRFNLVAGLLELADREFDTLTGEIDRYAADVTTSAKKGDLDIEINSTSVSQFLEIKLFGAGLDSIERQPVSEMVITELHNFDVKTLSDLDSLLSPEFLDSTLKVRRERNTYTGVLRDAMMYSNIDKYFEKSWDSNWQGCELEEFNLLIKKYGSDKVETIIRRYDLDSFEPPDFDNNDDFVEPF